MNWARHGSTATFEPSRAIAQVVLVRLGFKRRATTVLKSNLLRSIEFGTTVARHLQSNQVKCTPQEYINEFIIQTLFTWSGRPRSSGVSFFCFVSPRARKQKKLTPLDRGPPLHVNRPSKVKSVASCRFQIDLCILVYVMSREFTRERGSYEISTSSIFLKLM